MSMELQQRPCFATKLPSSILHAVIPDVREGVSGANMAKMAILGYAAIKVAVVAVMALKYGAIAGALYLAYNYYQKNSAIRNFEATAKSDADLPDKLSALQGLIQRLGVKISNQALESLHDRAAILMGENQQLKADLANARAELETSKRMSSILSGGVVNF